MIIIMFAEVERPWRRLGDAARSRRGCRLLRPPLRLSGVHYRGGVVKGGLAIYAFPLYNCDTLGSASYVQIESMPNC